MFRLNVINKISCDKSAFALSSVKSSSKIDDSMLWHARLGHVNFKRMLQMSKANLIPAINVNTEKCKMRMLTKITKQSFPNVKRNSVILDLIHSDICDFYSTPSHGNKKYVITFIDDYSRFCYVYLLHQKLKLWINSKYTKLRWNCN